MPVAPSCSSGVFVLSNIVRLQEKSALERILSVFAAVRPGEGFTALLLMIDVFTLLTAYYLIKPVREALILGGSGAEIKSYAGAAQALLFWLILPLYSAYASRTSRIRLINGVIAFFISNLALFYFLGRLNVHIGVIFFLWVGLFNVLLVAQFWALANDIYTEEQGQRLFAIVGIGSSLGAIAGARVSGWLFEPVGPYTMMLIAAALLGLCMILTNWIHRREGDHNRQRYEAARRPVGTAGGFRLVVRHRYLLLIAIMVLLGNLVNTTGEFILGKTVAEYAKSTAAGEAFIGQFYAGFFFWVNLLGAVLQMFAVSRIIKYTGIGPALFLLPIIALGSYTALAFAPILGFIRIAKIAENSTDYSIQNTVRHALFLNTSRDAKYKAQSAIESFFWRAGDALSALLVFVGTRLAFGVPKFAIANIFFVVVWIGVAALIVRLRKDQNGMRRQARAA
jgi:AAA family ATP:ADP antiporter